MAHTLKQKNLIMLGDWHKSSTGFGTVTKNLLPEFKSAFNSICFVAINYYGEPYKEGNVDIISAQNYFKPEGEDDPFGRHSLLNVLAVNNYDVCFIIQDFNLIETIATQIADIKNMKLKLNKKSFKTVFYFPVDGPIPKGYMEKAHLFDMLITYNNYSREQVISVRPELKSKVKIVPHGTNTRDFYVLPEPERKTFREQFFGKNAGKVIVSAINRNQPRKAIGDTILSFIEARKIWHDPRKLFLYLHMMDYDYYMSGYDLRKIFSQTDLVEAKISIGENGERTILDGDYMIADQKLFTEGQGADIETLRGIYNASDLFLTNTLGEGWGLSVSESMTCRLPVIAPNHTSIIEMGNNGERLYALLELEPFCSPFDSQIRERANIYECGEKICEAAEKMMDGSDRGMVDKAEKYVRGFKWENIAKQFLKYFEEVL